MKFCLWNPSAAVPCFRTRSFCELKRLKSHRVRFLLPVFYLPLFLMSLASFFVEKSLEDCEENILSSSGVRSTCRDCVHCYCVPLLTKEEGHLYENWCIFVIVCFSVGAAPAICVLLHRENVIATNHSCQERVKSSGGQWKSHIIFNYLIN